MGMTGGLNDYPNGLFQIAHQLLYISLSLL